MNSFLYGTIVLIWGTTWFAIHCQLGSVPILVSVFYRFAAAAAILLPVLQLLKLVQPTRSQDHIFFVTQGACLFSLNFICFYNATDFIASGLVSVVFSAATLFNAFNNWGVWKERPTNRVCLAGVLGISGLGLMFWQDFSMQDVSMDTLKGIGLAVLGTYLFSVGNMISIRNSKKGLKPLTTNAYSMIYGAAILFVLITITETPFSWDPRPSYFISLLYLAVPGTILGFTAYLVLVGRIGPNRAAYATVMFPVVALTISSVFENYHWHYLNLIGLVMTLSGNLILMNADLKKLFSLFGKRVSAESLEPK